jgi:hypothetical protein
VSLVAEARQYVHRISTGGRDSPDYFAKLLQLILTQSIMKNGAIKAKEVEGGTGWVIQCPRIGGALQLLDGRYLRVRYLAELDEQLQFTITESSIQFQRTASGGEIFRYDYKRRSHSGTPTTLEDSVASSHFQIYATLQPDDVPLYKVTLERQHFPCGRVSIESIIRFLMRDFRVRKFTDDEESEAACLELLAVSEELFLNTSRSSSPVR